ncbi:MAG TPA: ABC transporter substrate-binding protein [Acidimicrobiia bacterium]
MRAACAAALLFGAACGNFNSRADIARAAGQATAAGAGTESAAGLPVAASAPVPGEASAGASSDGGAGTAAAAAPTAAGVAGTGSSTGGATNTASAAPIAGAAGTKAGSSGTKAGASAGPTTTAPPAAGKAAGPAQAAPAAANTPVLMGHIGTYTGIVGHAFRNGLPMIQVAVRWINDNGGLNGHPIQLITADDRGDPARGLSLARQMVEQDGVKAFFINLTPLSAEGPAQYLDSKRIPVIGGDGLENTYFQHPMYFPQTGTPEGAPLGSIRSLVSIHGLKKIAILYCSEAAACTDPNSVLTDKVVAEQGGQLVYRAQISLAQPDFTAECLQARNNGAEAVLALTDTSSIIRIGRSCKQQNYSPKYSGISLGLTNSLEGDPNMEGLIGPTSVFPWRATDTDLARAFQAAIKQYGPANLEADSVSSAVWAGAQLVRAAGKDLPAQPGPNDFLAGLYKVQNNTFGGLTPPLTFQEGKLPLKQRCYFLGEIVGQKWTAPQGSKVTCL